MENKERYSRQIRLPQIGETGQKKIASLRILILGCGALGSACAEALVRMGVGFLRIVDRDIVEESNLPRQHLFTESDVAYRRPKVLAAQRKLKEINSKVEIEAQILDIHSKNIEWLLKDIDAVMDGFDRVEMRYLLNDACLKHRIPWFYAGIQGVQTLSMPVIPGQGPCLRCIFPEIPAENSLPTCESAGVLGSTVTVAASLQVSSLIRYFISSSSEFFLVSANLWELTFSKMQVKKTSECLCCGKHQYEFLDTGKISEVSFFSEKNLFKISFSDMEHKVSLKEIAEKLSKNQITSFLHERVLEINENKIRTLLFDSGYAFVYDADNEQDAKNRVKKYVE